MLDDLDLAWEEQEGRRSRGAPQSRQGRQRRRKERKRRRRSFGALFISFVMLVALGGGVYWGIGWLQENQSIKEILASDYDPGERSNVQVTVKVDKGALGADIGQALLQKNVVKSAKAFVNVYEADNRSKNIQPGSYKLYEHMPAKEAWLVLIDPSKGGSGPGVLVPEGLTMYRTFKLLSDKTKIPVAEFEAAAKDPIKTLGVPEYWFNRTDGKQPVVSAEGFLFPDTYAIDESMTAVQILKMMVNEFLTVAGDLKFADNVQKNLGISPHEALVVASLSQVEAGKNEDMPKVSRVAYNRAVKDGFPCKCLQFDVTANYWLESQGKPTKASKDMLATELDDKNNPFNTGPSTPGLPRGAISNPGKAALDGAMNPPVAKWIYFVAVDKNGTTKFSETSAQFEKDVAEARKNGVL